MLAICTVLRNEASKWLQSTLAAWTSFADAVIALDDGSTDATPEILKANSKVDYYCRNSPQMWGQEAEVRQELWKLFVHSGAEFGLWLDGDMVPASDPRMLFKPTEFDAWAFTLYDLWSLDPLKFRCDTFWQAHQVPRIWAVRNPGPSFEDIWPDRGIHCGHLPMNFQPTRTLYAPPYYGLLHLAYSDPEARLKKYEQYMSKKHLLSKQELEHAESILSTNIRLEPLPFPVEWDLYKYD